MDTRPGLMFGVDAAAAYRDWLCGEHPLFMLPRSFIPRIRNVDSLNLILLVGPKQRDIFSHIYYIYIISMQYFAIYIIYICINAYIHIYIHMYMSYNMCMSVCICICIYEI